MDKFEHQFETLDVQTAQMEDTMSNTTTLTTPQVCSETFITVLYSFKYKHVHYLLPLLFRIKWSL